MATKKLVKSITLEADGVYRAQINRDKMNSFADPKDGLNSAIDYFYMVLGKSKSTKPTSVPTT